MVFKIYAEKKEKSLELTSYRLKNINNVKNFLLKFFEDQKDWLREENRLGRGLGYEIVFVDDEGNDLPMKNLYTLLHSQDEIISFFSMTADAIGEILAEGMN